jgi:hypothetical protein
MLETKITLRVVSTVRTLSELERTLGSPSRGFSKGDISRSSGKPREKTYWGWQSKSPRSAPFESHLQELLAFIDSIKEFEQLQESCEVDVVCMLSTTNGQGGATLSYASLAALAALRLDLVLDVYGDSEDG